MNHYFVNELFYSIQGEGARTGSANIFIRFAGCNLKCNVAEHGFDCDTDWSNGIQYTADELFATVESLNTGCKSIIWTGGEPALQLDSDLLRTFSGFFHCVETNGTKELPSEVNWISCSPKTAEHTLAFVHVDELRYVRADKQALPKPQMTADHYFLSPTFEADGSPNIKAVLWCQKLVKENPTWKLSIQTHKLLVPIR